ncbi:uncharacterized protein LOC134699088 [Mytilus trossulus]|uniref:uncharacterized protein LOC134699088 n=1 Tax=Mytilus trossulus TaxID=6551 RepID=UPI0030049D48
MCNCQKHLKDMSYLLIFINAIVVALMAMYVYENERKMEKMSTKQDLTEKEIGELKTEAKRKEDQINEFLSKAETEKLTQIENQQIEGTKKLTEIENQQIAGTRKLTEIENLLIAGTTKLTEIENLLIAGAKKNTEVENILLQSNEKGHNISPAFHASMVRHPYTFSDPNEILRFEHVWTNIGDGYHSDTGVFVVPRDGLYQIMGTLWSTDGKQCAANLYKNDSRLNYGYAGAEHARSNTVHALVILKKDDKIYFKNRESTSFQCHGNYHSEFSGWFVHK